jgi:hypothetical protein
VRTIVRDEWRYMKERPVKIPVPRELSQPFRDKALTMNQRSDEYLSHLDNAARWQIFR